MSPQSLRCLNSDWIAQQHHKWTHPSVSSVAGDIFRGLVEGGHQGGPRREFPAPAGPCSLLPCCPRVTGFLFHTVYSAVSQPCTQIMNPKKTLLLQIENVKCFVPVIIGKELIQIVMINNRERKISLFITVCLQLGIPNCSPHLSVD